MWWFQKVATHNESTLLFSLSLSFFFSVKTKEECTNKRNVKKINAWNLCVAISDRMDNFIMILYMYVYLWRENIEVDTTTARIRQRDVCTIAPLLWEVAFRIAIAFPL